MNSKCYVTLRRVNEKTVIGSRLSLEYVGTFFSSVSATLYIYDRIFMTIQETLSPIPDNA